MSNSNPWAAASAMLANAKYVRQELPQIYLEEPERAKVLHLCENWESIYFDLIDDELSRGLAERWARQEIDEAHEVVQLLDAASQRDRRYGLAYILVCESAVNVLSAFNGKQEEEACQA